MSQLRPHVKDDTKTVNSKSDKTHYVTAEDAFIPNLTEVCA